MENHRIRIGLGVFLVSMASLLTETIMIRVFDVFFYPNISYMIISCSLLAYGVAGVYSAIKPLPSNQEVTTVVGKNAFLLAVSIMAILPLMNLLPFDINEIAKQPVRQLLYFSGMYVSLAMPFYFAGRILTLLFSRFAREIGSMYFWDLTGASLGSILVIPLIKPIGPGGILFVATAICLLATGLFFGKRSTLAGLGVMGVILIMVPVTRSPAYLDFKEHQGKRGVKYARENGLIDVTVWDPISKIDIINYGTSRYIAYDGGSQTSLFFPFDGDYQKLKAELPEEINKHFWQRGVLVSHMLREGSSPKVLVIGSAGGQEIKAALLYGAEHVDAVELVGAVVDLGRDEYSEYIGDLFHDPSVTLYVDEGRNFLRTSQVKYDIIQIFSNHTSSSVAAGTGAAATNYLQTSDAYVEYFSHLSQNGILHINHFYYPKMITTAALAWAQMGYDDFERHVIVYEYDRDSTLPTLLISMKPWTAEEVRTIQAFFGAGFPGDEAIYKLAVDPINPGNNLVPPSYFTGHLSQKDIAAAGIRIEPATDDRPYFNLLERSFLPIQNGRVRLDLATFFITGVVALLFGILFILLPLNFSTVGKLGWRNKSLSLIYFSCLGAGFIIIEFVFIQKFMRIIGSPLYTVAAVLFVMLSSAGIGSYATKRLGVSHERRWFVPFAGILVMVLSTSYLLPILATYSLGATLFARILFVILALFPVGFFMGMPFPLGVSTLVNEPEGIIAWAWGMNGLFTIIGGLLAVILSIQWGFTATLLAACGIYIFALYTFSLIRARLGFNRV